MFNFLSHKMPTITVSGVKKALDEKQDFILLDVRTREEYEENNILGSLNIPVDKLSENMEELLPDKNKTIYVYCRSGVRSAQAVQKMIESGYKHVYNIEKGIVEWQKKGFALA